MNKLSNRINLELENNKLRTKKTNIPSPKIVATWLGPKPPDKSELEPVPIKADLISKVYIDT